MTEKRWSKISLQLLILIKFSIICLYLSITYWIALNVNLLGMLFYPSLGSFSFLILGRKFQLKNLFKITLGAAVTSTIGSCLYFWYPSGFSLFLTALITLYMMKIFDWDAAPILAVALIPFFSHPQSIWVLPISVLCSLIGLLIPLWLIQKLENKKQLPLTNIQIHIADKMDVS